MVQLGKTGIAHEQVQIALTQLRRTGGDFDGKAFGAVSRNSALDIRTLNGISRKLIAVHDLICRSQKRGVYFFFFADRDSGRQKRLVSLVTNERCQWEA